MALRFNIGPQFVVFSIWGPSDSNTGCLGLLTVGKAAPGLRFSTIKQSIPSVTGHPVDVGRVELDHWAAVAGKFTIGNLPTPHTHDCSLGHVPIWQSENEISR